MKILGSTSYAATVLRPAERDALTEARLVLVACGFEVGSTPEGLRALGPGMRSSRQNGILGAQEIQIRVTDTHLHLEAHLGAMRRLQLFALIFPAGLLCLLGGVLWVILGEAPPGTLTWVLVFLLLMGPVLSAVIRTQVLHALDRFAASLAA